MQEAIAVLAVYAHAVAVGLLATGTRNRRLTAVALATLGLAVPFFLPISIALVRGVVALAFAMVLFRAIDFARESRVRSVGARLWHMVALFDTRRIRRVASTIDGRGLVRVLVYGAAAAVALYVALGIAPTLVGWRSAITRWSGGVVAVYTGFEAVVAFVDVLYRSLGVQVPMLHDHPVLGRSIQEFWSRRWNRLVSTWLELNCFRPIARRHGGALGLLAAFGASAALHLYFTWAAVGAEPAAQMGAFFLLQVPIVAVERALNVRDWPIVAARAWCIGVLLAASPLFIEPAMRILEMRSVAPLSQRRPGTSQHGRKHARVESRHPGLRPIGSLALGRVLKFLPS